LLGLDDPHGLLAIPGLADNREAVVELEAHLQNLADRLLVVDDDDAKAR
jgi:hypothetical protein